MTTVLILDNYDIGIQGLFAGPSDQLIIETLEPPAGLNGSAYSAENHVLNHLRSLEKNQPDLIVIGNNRGSGLEKADAIPEALRSRAVVVWNIEPREDDIAPYRSMGYLHFMRRGALRKFLREHPEVYSR